MVYDIFGFLGKVADFRREIRNSQFQPVDSYECSCPSYNIIYVHRFSLISHPILVNVQGSVARSMLTILQVATLDGWDPVRGASPCDFGRRSRRAWEMDGFGCRFDD